MSARTLLRGGRVHSPTHPRASALCVEGGEVVWVGDDEAATAWSADADRIVDLAGRLVTPAFVDAHAHLAQTGFALTGLDLSGVPTMTAALDALAAHVRGSRAPVLLGNGWDETTWPEGRLFTRAEVDRASDGRPVYLSRVDGHSAVVSSSLLDACPQVAAADGYAVDGRLERDAHHMARVALFVMIPGAARAEAIQAGLLAAARAGIGLVHELGAPHICLPEDFDAIAGLAAQQAVPEVVGYWGSLDVEAACELGCAGAAGDLCMDGAIGSRTAALHAAYADEETTRGYLYLEARQVRDHVVACTRAGIQAGFHVIGDRAVAEVVAGFRLAAEVVGTEALVRGRHRLEHLEMVFPEQLATLALLGVTASVQPMFDGLWGGERSMYAERLGAQRAAPMNPFASMLRAGVALAFGSDSPVTPFDPWSSVRAATWHHTESERIGALDAFEAHTQGGWRAARRAPGGVLEPGAPASLAVWDVPDELTDAGLPRLHPDEDLPTCLMTVVAGQVAFEETGALA